MNETAFTAKIRDRVAKRGGGSIKLGASMFLPKGTPDLVLTISGVTVFLEDKVHPNDLSKIQIAVAKKMKEEGFFVFCVKLMPSCIMVDDESFEDIDKALNHIEEVCIRSLLLRIAPKNT